MRFQAMATVCNSMVYMTPAITTFSLRWPQMEFMCVRVRARGYEKYHFDSNEYTYRCGQQADRIVVSWNCNMHRGI